MFASYQVNETSSVGINRLSEKEKEILGVICSAAADRM
jgi:hypothetical protein